jgi:succinoglycan biosynthesis transport protein ExoP
MRTLIPEGASFALRDTEYAVQPLRFQGEAEQVFPLGHYVWLMQKNWWKLALTVLVCTGLAAIICFELTPQYEATARITIDQKTPSALSDNALPNGVSDIDQILNTEMQLIQSDAVLRPVAEQFHLRAHEGEPDHADNADAPVLLKNLSVTRTQNSLLLNIQYRSPDAYQAAAVANAVAHSYITLGMEMRARSAMGYSAFMEKQISELKKNMDNSALALAGYEKQLGVINADEKTSILTARLMQLNTQYTDAENERIRKETEYRALKSNSLAALEASPQASGLAHLSEAMQAAEAKMASAATVYGPNYPEYKRAASELAEVKREHSAMKTEVARRIETEYKEAQHRQAMLRSLFVQAKSESDRINANSYQYQQLKREAEANKSLYNELFRKIKEASIDGGRASGIRIADEARPLLKPVFPNKKVILPLSSAFSLLLAIVCIIIGDMSDKTLRDPEQVERTLGANVVGILPYMQKFSLASQHTTLDATGVSLKLATPASLWYDSPSIYDESVSASLSSLLLDRTGRSLRSLLMTSALPGEGKSSCAANMAAAHARQGHKTLLIDADLRCPYQARFFGLDSHNGLADAITRGKSLEQVRQSVEGIENLDVIVAGIMTGRITERVGTKVGELLAEAGKHYDLVIVDAPPILYFAEPIQVACLVDGVLVVSEAGETDQQAVACILGTLRRLHANVVGIVLNRVKFDMSPSYRPYEGYSRYMSREA